MDHYLFQVDSYEIIDTWVNRQSGQQYIHSRNPLFSGSRRWLKSMKVRHDVKKHVIVKKHVMTSKSKESTP